MNTMMTIEKLQFEFEHGDSSPIRIDHLHLDQGTLLAILGSSGAGKTTILRLIAGLLTPMAGSITLWGKEISHKPASNREIGMVFQNPMLFPYLNVLGNVAFPLRLQGLSKSSSRKSAREYLELVGMAGFADRQIQTLSGGQSQRVALARALAARPQVLLLDEPFAALDVDVRAEMQELVIRLRKELSLTMVLVTHDQREAALLADTVALVENGKILQQGEISELFRRPNSVQVFRAMGGVNAVSGKIEGGVFYSPLGKLPIHPDNAIEGLVTLTIRQEAVEVSPQLDANPHLLVGKTVSVRKVGFRFELGVQINSELLRIESNYRSCIGEEVAVKINFQECNFIPVGAINPPELLLAEPGSKHRANEVSPVGAN